MFHEKKEFSDSKNWLKSRIGWILFESIGKRGK